MKLSNEFVFSLNLSARPGDGRKEATCLITTRKVSQLRD